MPVAAPDWGALAGQLEQLLPHLAEARTAKAQLYQIGILNSQLLQAGSSGGAPTSEDERQRMLGLLEGLWEQLLSLFADLNNRVGLDGAPKPPQLRSCMQWWPVFEGACQLLQGGAQAAIACRMSAAAAAPLMAVNNLLQAVGIMFGCRASPLAPAQHAAVIACQLNARAALLLLAEASGWLSQINIMSKAHVAFLIPAIMDLNSAAVPEAVRGQPTQALLRLLATICTVCQRSPELSEAQFDLRTWDPFGELEQLLETRLARMAVVLALPAERRPAGAPGWDAAVDVAIVLSGQLGVPALPSGQVVGAGSAAHGGGGGDTEPSGDAGSAADAAPSVSSGVSAARAAAQLVALMPLPGTAVAEAAGEPAEAGSSSAAPSASSLSCTDAVWLVCQLGRTARRLLACLEQQRQQQAAAVQQEQAAALQRLVHPLLQALPNLVATLQLAADGGVAAAAATVGAAAAGAGAEAAQVAGQGAAAGRRPGGQVTGQQWVAACEAAQHTLQLLLATLQPEALQQQQQHAAALGVAADGLPLTADGAPCSPAVGSFADAAAWGHGLSSALRLLALMDAASQLEAEQREAAGAAAMLARLMDGVLQTCLALSLAVDAFGGAATAFVQRVLGFRSAVPAAPSAAAPGGTAAEAVIGLWQLHSALCRAAQFAAARQGAGGSPTARALLGQVDTRQLSNLAFAFLLGSTALHAVHHAAQQVGPPGGGAEAADAAQISRALHAMGAAQVELLQIAGAFSSDDGASAETRSWSTLVLLPLLAAAAPALVTSVTQLRQLCEQVLPSLSYEERQAFVGRILPHSSRTPQAAWALLLCCRAEDIALAPAAQANQAAEHVCMAVATLLRGVAEAVGAAAEQQQIGGEGSEAEDGLQRLKAALQAAAPFSTLTDGSRGVEATLAASRPLAQALLQWWQRPEGQEQHRLEMARVAAARSCANLRCANVGLEGGPAAGQVAGCKRCSRCRAVWYCGTACSHADWRGPSGHKHVCQALGEERRAEKQRRRQAAAGSSRAAAAGGGRQ